MYTCINIHAVYIYIYICTYLRFIPYELCRVWICTVYLILCVLTRAIGAAYCDHVGRLLGLSYVWLYGSRPIVKLEHWVSCGHK